MSIEVKTTTLSTETETKSTIPSPQQIYPTVFTHSVYPAFNQKEFSIINIQLMVAGGLELHPCDVSLIAEYTIQKLTLEEALFNALALAEAYEQLAFEHCSQIHFSSAITLFQNIFNIQMAHGGLAATNTALQLLTLYQKGIPFCKKIAEADYKKASASASLGRTNDLQTIDRQKAIKSCSELSYTCQRALYWSDQCSKFTTDFTSRAVLHLSEARLNLAKADAETMQARAKAIKIIEAPKVSEEKETSTNKKIKHPPAPPKTKAPPQKERNKTKAKTKAIRRRFPKPLAQTEIKKNDHATLFAGSMPADSSSSGRSHQTI